MLGSMLCTGCCLHMYKPLAWGWLCPLPPYLLSSSFTIQCHDATNRPCSLHHPGGGGTGMCRGHAHGHGQRCRGLLMHWSLGATPVENSRSGHWTSIGNKLAWCLSFSNTQIQQSNSAADPGKHCWWEHKDSNSALTCQLPESCILYLHLSRDVNHEERHCRHVISDCIARNRCRRIMMCIVTTF